MLGEGGGKDNGEVVERRHAVVDSRLKRVDSLLALVLDEVPFVDHDHQTLVVLLDELEDVHVLRLDTARGIDHEDANVAVLYRADGAHDAVELQIFRNFVLAADACGVNKIEVETEFGIAGINGVAGSAGNLSDDVAVLTDKSIDNARLAYIGTPYNSKAGDVLVYNLIVFLGQFLHNKIQQVAGAATRKSADTHGVSRTLLPYKPFRCCPPCWQQG